MSESNFEKAFDSNMDGDKRNLRVRLIDPPSGDNPWRTREEYISEREKMRELQLKQIDSSPNQSVQSDQPSAGH